jgi:hypothetical protein
MKNSQAWWACLGNGGHVYNPSTQKDKSSRPASATQSDPASKGGKKKKEEKPELHTEVKNSFKEKSKLWEVGTSLRH